ncbi:MAG: autotransporter outer membrane beta-barrel domain-containing protein, partial [Candidatus Berkiella sp.]
VSYGDRNVIEFGTTRFRTWAQVFGTIIDQHKRNQVVGYKADSAGVSVGGDWRLTNEALVGAALSFNKVETLDYTSAQNRIDTWSYQATVYGWFEPWDKLYFDTMLAVASHKYDTLRNMQIGNYTANATATFLGTQYGAQADVGYAISQDNWYVAPYARFRYTYLDIGKYSETGAGGINLNVKNSPIDEMIAGIGLRLAVNQNYQTAIYVPEASATLLYDFAGKEQQMQSSFLGGGGFFYISSIKPAQLIQLYSLGVTAYTNDGYVAQLKFNFEHREQLFGYNAFLQISYLWD